MHAEIWKQMNFFPRVGGLNEDKQKNKQLLYK